MLESDLAAARRQLEAGLLHDAKDSYRRLLDGFPDSALGWHGLGLTLLQQGNLDDALLAMQRTVSFPDATAEQFDHLGIALAKAGRHKDAVAAFEQSINLDDSRADAHYNLAKGFRKLDRHEDALKAYQTALRLKPSWAEARFNIANTLHDLNRFEDAAENYCEAIRLKPNYNRAFNNLGNLFRAQGNLDEAEKCYRAALHIRPNYPEARHNLGAVLRKKGLVDESLQNYREAAKRNPQDGKSHVALGNALRKQGLIDEAVDCYGRALDLDPNLPDAHFFLGMAYKEKNDCKNAITHFERSLSLNDKSPSARTQLADTYRIDGRAADAIVLLAPTLDNETSTAEGCNVLGMCYYAEGDLYQAINAYSKSLDIQPDLPDAHNNLGAALQAVGRHDEAMEHFETALRSRPLFAIAHVNRALMWLRNGEYARGWFEFEWRRELETHRLRDYGRPLWTGGSLEGRTILLHAEQGVGDTFQFVRFAQQVKKRGGTVFMECQKAAYPLVQSCPGIDRVIERGKPLPEFDVQAPLVSLPGALGVTLTSIPARQPYVFADETLVDAWQTRLNGHTGFKVAIAWQGNPDFKADHLRSIPLSHYEHLATVDGVRLISVQKNDGVEQLNEIEDRFEVIDYSEELDTANGPFMDTAAVLRAVDLVVTSDTSLAHLAGAMHVPTWVAIPFAADWRWGDHTDACLWYPTVRLFRQPVFGDWTSVFKTMADELSLVVAGDRDRVARQQSHGVPAPTVPVSLGELLDKISILEIKADRMESAEKLLHVNAELSALRGCAADHLSTTPALKPLQEQLLEVNKQLWEIEDEIRCCERDGDFGDRFMQLARAVYLTNDRRAAIKKEVNTLSGSRLHEEKSYAEF
jgi:tetratricopeptide (TPR) repeat protein